MFKSMVHEKIILKLCMCILEIKTIPVKKNTSIKASPTEMQPLISGILNNVPENMCGGVVTKQKAHNCTFAMVFVINVLRRIGFN